MTKRLARVWLVTAAIFLGGGGVGQRAANAAAKAKSDKASGKAPVADAGPKKDVNACGCYKDAAGACFCGKKGSCACPGECEPKGCEEKRNKEIDKEVAAETKKAHEADKKQRSAEHSEHTAKAPAHKPAGAGP